MARPVGTITIEWERRLCWVNGESGYFHCWEHFSRPTKASPFIGGEPAGLCSEVYGIVELEDGVHRVHPHEIQFCDEEHQMIRAVNKLKKQEEAK